MGRDPELEFLDEFGRRADGTDRLPLANFDDTGIIELLRRNDITPLSPKPVFRDREFDRVRNCLGWRQTGGCAHDGPREPNGDGPCSHAVQSGASGYCQCAGGLAVVVDCEPASEWQEHHQEGATGWRKGGQTVWSDPLDDGWTKIDNMRRPYYYHPALKQSVWEKPEEMLQRREPFTCEDACEEGALPELRRRKTSEMRQLEEERRRRAADSGSDDSDVGPPETWPDNEL
eukprot:TRINITY_DN4389_c1_g2_i1.p1 TRINITY_DN4389_c1_g2~~TRINITY_DN4389_c1_g2_i1.p1  ORF type:complete len:231 (+),score=70.07 TRINITY_DN4389_c1_g2_i1:224-916(+)